MITTKRAEEIRKMVRQAIGYAVQEDAEGGEHILKPVWEECETDEENEVATDEAKSVAKSLLSAR